MSSFVNMGIRNRERKAARSQGWRAVPPSSEPVRIDPTIAHLPYETAYDCTAGGGLWDEKGQSCLPLRQQADPEDPTAPDIEESNDLPGVVEDPEETAQHDAVMVRDENGEPVYVAERKPPNLLLIGGAALAALFLASR